MTTSTEQLRFLVFGAGAIGTYVGGSLALNGAQVVFIEKPEVVKKLNQDGLHLELLGQDHQVNTLVVDSIEAALLTGTFTAGIVAIKAFDTAGFAEQLKPFKGSIPPIISLQNGIENEALLGEVIGIDNVISGSVTTAVGRKDIGNIVLERLRGIGLAGSNSITPYIAQIFDNAGLNCRYYRDAASMKWSKMITNLQANASAAILDYTPSEVFSNPITYHLEVRQLREALHVMAVNHIGVTNLPGAPVRLMAGGLNYLPEWISRILAEKILGKGRGNKLPSFMVDLRAGKKLTEVDYLNGAVVRAGQKAGIATPVNQAFTHILSGIASGAIPRQEFSNNPGALAAAIHEWENKE
ncbi:MAG TPA: 2-dehydropantoate 2-reductase [Longilinea sp.]|nr:2-dehydropantoate 2-reductase [Longilinea sp.]